MDYIIINKRTWEIQIHFTSIYMMIYDQLIDHVQIKIS
jgi:hypothetical protein